LFPSVAAREDGAPLTDPSVIWKRLAHLRLPTDPPPLAPARCPLRRAHLLHRRFHRRASPPEPHDSLDSRPGLLVPLRSPRAVGVRGTGLVPSHPHLPERPPRPPGPRRQPQEKPMSGHASVHPEPRAARVSTPCL